MNYLGLIKLRLEHEVLYQLLRMLLDDIRYLDTITLLISQLIFNGTVTSKLFVPSLPVLLVILTLNSNDSVLLPPSESTIFLLLLFKPGPSLQYCHKLPDVFE